jgi:hypothetical protein
MKLVMVLVLTLSVTAGATFLIQKTPAAEIPKKLYCHRPKLVPVRSHESGKFLPEVLARMPFASPSEARRFLDDREEDLMGQTRAFLGEIWMRLDSLHGCLGLDHGGPRPVVQVLLSWNLRLQDGRATAYGFGLRDVVGAPSPSAVHRCIGAAFPEPIQVPARHGRPLQYDGPAPAFVSYIR